MGIGGLRGTLGSATYPVESLHGLVVVLVLIVSMDSNRSRIGAFKYCEGLDRGNLYCLGSPTASVNN